MNKTERIEYAKLFIKELARSIAFKMVPLWVAGAIGGYLARHGDPFMGVAVVAIGLGMFWKNAGLW